MSNPGLPPYLGSWEELINALLHNPFLGSVLQFGPSPNPWFRPSPTIGPPPNPWFGMPWQHPGPGPDPAPPATMFLVYMSSLKVAASLLPEGQQRSELESSIERTIAAFLDDYCGTRTHPWPPPGPPPWVFTTASALTAVANSFQEGSLRNALLQVVSQLMQKAFAAQSTSER